ncbi:TPA: hypothetical protein DCZ32_03675, partial [Candidatus Uhrbacteria bacterium]|nr:hypothetical protein [Candidatus Uhrbacteria bacterium]
MPSKERPAIYSSEIGKEAESRRLSLSEQQKHAVRRITLGVESVDETVRQMAQEDVVKTLENGNPLNRLITDEKGETVGYIACEDFVPHEAYIKYLATASGTGRNPFREIPAFLEYAKKQGYTKLNFHGWNERLNRVMERYGFNRLRTDSWADLRADFYEATLAEQKTTEQINEERKSAFEDKYIQKINKQYEQILAGFSQDNRAKKETAISKAYNTLSGRLQTQAVWPEDFNFGDLQKTVLKLKLARHFQQNETIDLNNLFDAVTETPKFINNDSGSLHRLLEVHEEKTLQKIAEIRKQRAEMTGGKEESNPYEALFTTASGKYYLARLLNMPHLQEESEYMRNCVGTSDSYVNRIKKGEIEILSFRNVPKFNRRTNQLEGDTPILTIEYDVKNGIINQVKKADDEYLSPSDPYLKDVLDAFKQLRATQSDAGKPREVRKINSSELNNFKVRPYHILTDQGEVHFRDINMDVNPLILKSGTMELTSDISQKDAAKLMRIFENVDIEPSKIARTPQEINETTKAYVGPLERDIFNTIQQFGVEHIYTSFPEGKIHRYEVELGGKSKNELIKELKQKNIYVSDWANQLLDSKDFQVLKKTEHADLVRLTVKDLGFDNGATIDEIFKKAIELGMELCPPEVGPQLRLSYTGTDWMLIGMKQISDRGGNPHVFYLHSDAAVLKLNASHAKPEIGWTSVDGFVFRLRPSA